MLVAGQPEEAQLLSVDRAGRRLCVLPFHSPRPRAFAEYEGNESPIQTCIF